MNRKMAQRINIVGASGSGTTTLGRTIALNNWLRHTPRSSPFLAAPWDSTSPPPALRSRGGHHEQVQQVGDRDGRRIGRDRLLAAFLGAATTQGRRSGRAALGFPRQELELALGGLRRPTNAIAKDAGLPVQYQVMIFGDLIPALASGKIDVIATNMAITPTRAQQVDFQ